MRKLRLFTRRPSSYSEDAESTSFCSVEVVMNIVNWEPFREMDDLFNRYARMARHNMFRGETEAWMPSADITETDKEYLIKANLPEVRREDVKVTLDNGAITISGERKREKEEKGESEIRMESFYGTFSRS